MPQAQWGRQKWKEQFTDIKMTVDDKPKNVLTKLEELAESLTKRRTTMPKSQVHARFASLLPPEYEWHKEYLRQKTEL